MNAISATPSALAQQLGFVWKHNSQTILVSKNKQEPDTLPMELVNFISEVADIPQYAAQFQLDQNKSDTKELLLNNRRSLEYQGLNVDELSPSDDALYGATGRQVHLDTATKKQAAACYLLDRRSLCRLNAAAWPTLAQAFDLSVFKDLSPTLPAMHAFQLLLILLANKTLHDKLDLQPYLANLGTCALATSDDLVAFTSALNAAGVLDNILKFDHPFQPNKDLVQRTLRTAQSGPQVAQLPHRVRTAVEKILQKCQDDVQAGHFVRPDRVLLQLAPYFQPAPPPPTQPGSDSAELPIAMLAREPFALHGPASDPAAQFPPPEAAFMARTHQRPDPRRPAPTWDRQDRPDRSWDRQADNPAPASGAPRPARRLLDDDADHKELMTLQKALQTLVAKISKKDRKSSSDSSSANMAAHDPVQHTVPQEATYHAQLQSDSDSDVELFH
jgi:hypothetical protein